MLANPAVKVVELVALGDEGFPPCLQLSSSLERSREMPVAKMSSALESISELNRSFLGHLARVNGLRVPCFSAVSLLEF